MSLTVGAPTGAQPPSGLHASSVLGNLVTLRWTPPAFGATPTQYALKSGLVPGQVLASYATGSPYPIFTFVAPTGSFYVRMHSLVGTGRSAASSEIRLHVNVPVPPSPPAGLLGLANGSTLDLTWRNTFEGGPPARMAHVTGAFVGGFPTTGRALSSAAAPGSYNLSVVATNPCGTSAATPVQTVTVPPITAS